MAQGRNTTALIAGGGGLLAGTVLGGFLGRGGFFGEGAGTHDPSGVITPGGAIGADAQASVAAGGRSEAPNASGAIQYPTSPSDIVPWVKRNPLIAVGLGLGIAFLIYRFTR